MNIKRIYFLDSLRGIAAVTVVVAHLAGSLVVESFPKDIFQSFGRNAVVLFFILSGTALSMSLQKNNRMTLKVYTSYIVKRVCRIYLPFFIIIILSYCLFLTLQPQYIEGLSDWFNAVGTNVSMNTLMDNILMSGSHVGKLDPVIWSLIVEMRVSIIFPILFFFLRKMSWKVLLLSAGTAFMGGTGILFIIGQKFLIGQTIFHIGFFILGVGIFLHQSQLQVFIVKAKVEILATSLVLYLHVMFLNIMGLGNIQVVSDVLEGLGAVGILLVCYNSNRLQRGLNRPLYRTLGKYSFSIYLVHCIVFIPLIHILYPYNFTFLAMEGMSIPLIFIFAAIVYWSIEKPSQALGRLIGSNIEARMAVSGNLMKGREKFGR
ncbi:acyltransferase [Listeria booriae]|uniref:acyltransferase family protein n=1 Tax=Listeria booriae TaxID=1552123 RepID=UPI0016271B9B|nr:acyltransferase [Listeria booriae]MBC2370204.1 acyltransferase [Listeria booriae]